MSLDWNDAYRVGNTTIDAQHQELFRLANVFLSASDKAGLTGSAMGFFKYAREHFSHEEVLMKELGYPFIVEHVFQHNGLISELNDVAKNIGTKTVAVQDLERLLSEWLFHHIGTSDAKLADYVKSQVPAHDGS